MNTIITLLIAIPTTGFIFWLMLTISAYKELQREKGRKQGEITIRSEFPMDEEEFNALRRTLPLWLIWPVSAVIAGLVSLVVWIYRGIRNNTDAIKAVFKGVR